MSQRSYAVCCGEHSDFHVVATFSTEERAKAFVAALDGKYEEGDVRIQEYAHDPELEFLFVVIFQENGLLTSCYIREATTEFPTRFYDGEQEKVWADSFNRNSQIHLVVRALARSAEEAEAKAKQVWDYLEERGLFPPEKLGAYSQHVYEGVLAEMSSSPKD